MILKLKNYIPLFVVEFYLLITLFIFLYGPINYNIHNVGYFTLLITLYHLFFILGYHVAVKTYVNSGYKYNKFSNKFYWIVFIFGLFSALKAYQNAMLGESIIPFNIINQVSDGFSNPGLVYSALKDIDGNPPEAGSRIINIISIFFAFSKLLFIFITIYYWKDLSLIKKYVSITYCFLFIAPGIAAGINSVIFLFFIFSASSYIIINYIKNEKKIKMKWILFVTSILLFVPVYYFGRIMSERGGGFEYFSGTSPLGDITTATKSVDPNDANFFEFFYYSFVWLSYYVTQGYYGFSLILNMDHDWTFGFGSSAFLQRQFEQIFGVNISHLTYQSKIDSYWDVNAQWHSFYSQVSNDFTFVGVVFLMLFIGYYFANVWMSVIRDNSFYGAALLPVFAIMFIFFPANNQVFGYIDTTSYAIFISLFWILHTRRVVNSQKLFGPYNL